ncbi:MAG: glycosyltransferase [Dehalococcoidia bacterium]
MKRPSVSVIIPTTVEWPASEPIVSALQAQVVDAGAEIVVVDGTPTGTALDLGLRGARHEHLRVIHSPGSDIFTLRSRGLAEAAGEIVAMTEEHCVPAPDYITTILASHVRHPEQAIAGAVVNGSTRRLIDRVNFMVVHARNLPPREELPGDAWIPTASNASYKRVAISSAHDEPGWLETVRHVQLLHAHEIAFDDGIVVAHVQSLGVLGTFRNHFHAGRSTGGLARTAIGSRARQLRWGLRSTASLPVHLTRPVWQLRNRWSGTSSPIVLVLPIALALSMFDAIGFIFGVIAGPGRSPWRLS